MKRGEIMIDRTSPRPGRAGRAAALGVLSAALCSCVTLLPKTKPVQLYTFGQLPPPQRAASPAPGVGVVLATISMPNAAVGDQILSETGQQAAYISGARWIVPAGLMFQSDADRAFETRSRRIHLLHRGDLGVAAALLHLDVGDFEARYDASAAAPTVVVSLRATLTRPVGALIAEQSFTARQPAEANRLAPIAAAFDKAVIDVLSQVVDWTDANAPASATPTPAATQTTTSTSISTTTSTTGEAPH